MKLEGSFRRPRAQLLGASVSGVGTRVVLREESDFACRTADHYALLGLRGARARRRDERRAVLDVRKA